MYSQSQIQQGHYVQYILVIIVHIYLYGYIILLVMKGINKILK